MSSGQQYSADVMAWAHLVGVSIDALARQSIQALVENVLHDSPFDTGNLRSQWQPAINSEPPENSPPSSLSSISMVISQVKPGDTFVLRNGTNYAARLEYGFTGQDSLGRNYNQPGRFYVQQNIARWPQIVSFVAADLSGRLG